jgi:Fe-Mn family superoxide dismutase
MFFRKRLSYEFNDLFPFIDGETMFEHYEKHYKKYTDLLNEELKKQNINSQNIISVLKQHSNITTIRNNGGGYYNHLLYFENISPYQNYFNFATENMKSALLDEFDSLDKFMDLFKNAGLSVFGSGWAWLINHNGKLKIATTRNQDNPVMSLDCDILLGMDVWEHAYYLKHKSDREGYIKDFFEVIDWKIVSQRL